MLGYDQIDTFAERLIGRIPEQRETGRVPANDRTQAGNTDDSIGDLIKDRSANFDCSSMDTTPLELTD